MHLHSVGSARNTWKAKTNMVVLHISFENIRRNIFWLTHKLADWTLIITMRAEMSSAIGWCLQIIYIAIKKTRMSRLDEWHPETRQTEKQLCGDITLKDHNHMYGGSSGSLWAAGRPNTGLKFFKCSEKHTSDTEILPGDWSCSEVSNINTSEVWKKEQWHSRKQEAVKRNDQADLCHHVKSALSSTYY